jgi:xanthine dehydrogenase small subunit
MIHLSVNGHAYDVEAPPLARLLDVLRLSIGLTGTKEGCGEGECGSCTVLLDGAPVNSCLVSAGQCGGRELLTIEGLASGEELSPLQQCFIESGGAQCGICTPGMLLAAEALLRDNARPTESEIRDAIAGNLCRCTGYKRIVDAISDAAIRRDDSRDLSSTQPIFATSAASPFSPPSPPAGLERTRLMSPGTVAEACDLLAKAHAAGLTTEMLAGGTDWIVDRHLLHVEKASPVDQVIDLTGIESLSQIALRDDGGEQWMSLGGGVTYWALRRDARVAAAIPMLAAMARDVGAVQIQRRGTLGGNIATASPAADGVPALMALDGVVVLVSVRGERRVPLGQFFTGYRKTVLREDELIAAIDVRIPREGAVVTWRKVGTRLAQAISKVALAAALETDAAGIVTRARFGMASVAAVTTPLDGVRRAVEGKALASLERDALDAAVAAAITPIDDVRSNGTYRLHVAKALVWRALQGKSAID